MKTSTTLVTMTMTVLLLAFPAAASDYTLGIFGNANEDDTINMQDVTYTELIILEFRDETELADAKHDGKINMQDVTQIELVILGKEKELTLVDAADRIVTVNKPVERMIPLGTSPDLVVVKALGAKDKVIAVPEYMKEYEYTTLFPEISKLPSVGYYENIDYEKIFELAPDLVIAPYYLTGELEETLEPEITVVCLNCGPPLTYTEEVRKLIHILNTEEDGEEFIAWYEGMENYITEKTAGLSEGEKTRVFDYCGGEWGMSEGPPYATYGKENFWVPPLIEMAGGINIAGDLPGDWIGVDPEWVIRENPEVIIREIYPMISGHILSYDTDDSSEAAALWVDIMSQPGFKLSDAVKEENVYLCYGDIIKAYWFVGLPYMAKWFHPELFSELDPQAFHQEFLTEFQGLDFNVYEHGVFVYPPFEN